jgi:hypothetical protein
MTYKITVGKYSVMMLDSVKIVKSVENLADTAVIVLPGTYINRALRIEDRIKAGDPVSVELGYGDSRVPEFEGFLTAIATDDATLKLECEDSLYLFRVPLKDRELKNVGLKSLLQTVLQEAGDGLSLECDYEFTWDKFTFFRASALDVLKKVQDETKANIYFRGGVLHVHPQYAEITNTKPVIFDFAVNVEKSDLKYVRAADRKIEVEVTATLPDGTVRKLTHGTPGGTKISVAAGTADAGSMKRRAEQQYSLYVYDGFEGSFTGWLVPYVEPAYKITLRDSEYPYRNGDYYVVATETEFGASGGKRKIITGKKTG